MAVLPSSFLGGIIAPVCLFCLLVVACCTAFVLWYRSRRENEISAIISCIFCLSVAVILLGLIPVDVFAVSFMKSQNGTFREWVGNYTQEDVSTAMLRTYYALYGVMMFLIFMVLPFGYFYYEERDDELMPSVCERLGNAFKFTLGFLIAAAVILVVGAIIPLKTKQKAGTSEWVKIQNVMIDFSSSHGENALSFMLSLLMLVGWAPLVMYSAWGMAAMPVYCIRGWRAAWHEHVEIAARREAARTEAESIRSRYGTAGTGRLSSRHRRRLEELDESDHLLGRQQRHLDRATRSFLEKARPLVRPLQIILGIFLLLLALLFIVSLSLTNFDRALHSLGYQYGFALPVRKIFNPLDALLALAHKVFPLDYVLFALLIFYVFVCTLSGVIRCSIRACCVKLYSVRPHRTAAQALFCLCAVMLLVSMATNVLLYEISPDYITYGTQQYWHNGTLEACNTQAPASECHPSRAAFLLMRLFYKLWFFPVCYYVASWLFVLVFLIGLGFAACKRRSSAIEGHVDADEFDSDDNDEIA